MLTEKLQIVELEAQEGQRRQEQSAQPLHRRGALRIHFEASIGAYRGSSRLQTTRSGLALKMEL